MLSWNKCEGDKWCPLLTVNLDHPHFNNFGGVYIIWSGGQTPATVYVGQGEIAARLKDHRKEQDILQHSHLGLFVTWAKVGQPNWDGVERFLADRLLPKEGTRHPNVTPIQVNLPW